MTLKSPLVISVTEFHRTNRVFWRIHSCDGTLADYSISLGGHNDLYFVRFWQ